MRFTLITTTFLSIATNAFGQQLPPSPAAPDCPTHSQNHLHVAVCHIYAQAGIPFSGRVAEYGSCGPNGVANLKPAVVWWDGDKQTYDIADEPNTGYLRGTHTYSGKGDSDLKVGVEMDCIPGGNRKCPSGTSCSRAGTVHVEPPWAPKSIFISAIAFRPGRYHNVGSVELGALAPRSGMMLKLSTSRGGLVDIQTDLGHTQAGVQDVFIWVPPGVSAQTFDLIIDKSASAGLEALIAVDCAGKYEPNSQCDPVNGPSKSASLKVSP